MSLAQIDSLISAIIRGEKAIWPLTYHDRAAEEAFVHRAKYHGVIALLYERLSQLASWPPVLLKVLHRDALAQAMWELRHQQVLKELIGELQTRGVEPILFKGTALAYGLYPNSAWRARGDTDMIVDFREWQTATEVLNKMGFGRNESVTGEFVSYQDSFTREVEDGSRHTIDLHKRINNSQCLSRIFSYTELRAQAHPLPSLCKKALAADSVSALLLACLHPATHRQIPYYVDGAAYYGGNRLIWHYDVFLLAQSFTALQWRDFIDQAARKGLRKISHDALKIASDTIGAPYPDNVRQELESAGVSEPVAKYLSAGWIRQSWKDLLAIPGSRNRLRFVRETVFPSAAYMRSKYHEVPKTPLIWLYARRAVGGLIKRMFRQISR